MRRREANHDAVASFAGSYVRPCLPFRGLLVTAVCLISGTSPVWAEGFRNPPPGAFNLGRAGGRIAQVDDSSAVQQNPANLVDLPTTEMQFAPTVVDISAKFKSPNGQTAETEDPWKLIPNFFAGMPLDDGRFALGLGITVPFGLGSKWKEDSSAFAGSTGIWRYQAPQSTDLQTINVNPAVAMKIGERLRLGVGLDVMWTELTLKEFYPWAMFPGSAGTEPDGDVEAKGDGFGVGANAGVTWSITDRQRLAFTVRSPMDVTCEGNFTINNLTPAAGAAGVSRGTDFSTEVHFPTILAAGYGIQLTDKIRVEADGEWVQFSRFKSLDLNVGKDALLFPTTKFAENWKDTFTAGLGGDWKFATNWVLRAGYQFYQSPVPDSTFSPTIPDADQNVFTIGLGYRYKHHSLEAAYGADFYDTRHIRNDKTPAFNGDYEITVNLFSFAYRYSF
jgi:long-chain fatty acid transport protein